MDEIYFDVSNVRGFAEQLHHDYENDYKQEIALIRSMLLGDSASQESSVYADAASTKPMGNVDAGYYGRDIAETQTENIAAALNWLEGFEESVEAMINAGLYIAEEMETSDAANAAGIDRFFEAPTFGDMDYLDPSSDYPGR